MSSSANSLSIDMRTAIGLTEVFVVAIVIALFITVANVTASVQVLAVVSVTPIIVLSLIFIYYCRKRRLWGYVGASILGALGICLRVIVSTQPSLEVGGGLPVGITVLYIVLGALVSLKNYEAALELKDKAEEWTPLTEQSSFQAYCQRARRGPTSLVCKSGPKLRPRCFVLTWVRIRWDALNFLSESFL